MSDGGARRGVGAGAARRAVGEMTGAQAYDSSILEGTSADITPTGAVKYDLYDNGTCSGTAATTELLVRSRSFGKTACPGC